MQERLKYVNHLNEVIDFGRNGIYVGSSNLHDYNWSVQTKNDGISSFRKTVTSRTLPVSIFCPTVEAGVAARNRLMEVAEKDVLAQKPGRLVVGDYYYKCYITESKKGSYLRSRQLMEAKLTIMSDAPYWVKETTHAFRNIAEESAGKNLDFAVDHPFDYFSGIGTKELKNTDFVGTNFRMVIYGACSNPAVYVSGHLYQVNCEVDANAYLTIDSVSKRIYVTANDGTVTNVFNLRNRDSYIFKKIPPGKSIVTWDGDFGIDITLLEERSEPKWT